MKSQTEIQQRIALMINRFEAMPESMRTRAHDRTAAALDALQWVIGEISEADASQSLQTALDAVECATVSYVTRRLTGSELRRGMRIDGREIASVMQGYGSGKIWTYLEYTTPNGNGSFTDRVRKNTVKIEVEVPTGE